MASVTVATFLTPAALFGRLVDGEQRLVGQFRVEARVLPETVCAALAADRTENTMI